MISAVTIVQCEMCSNKILCILILDCTIYAYLILVIKYIFILNNIRMKKFMRIAFVAAFAAIAGYGVYTNLKTDVMSDLALANNSDVFSERFLSR